MLDSHCRLAGVWRVGEEWELPQGDREADGRVERADAVEVVKSITFS